MRKFIQDKGRSKRPQLWTIDVRGNEVTCTWGLVGGKMQETTQVYEAVNIGKANEKSPGDKAADEAERMVLGKIREGYVEVDDTLSSKGQESLDLINFDEPLPVNLRFYKPQNSMNKTMEKAAIGGMAWFVRKRNGEMIVAAKHSDGGWRFYSSKLLLTHKNEPGIPWIDRFPHLERELDMLDLPNNTILLCELVAGRYNDDLAAVGSVTKSLTDRALDLQKENPCHLCIWDIAFFDNEPLVAVTTYRERYYTLVEMLGDPLLKSVQKFKYLVAPEVFAAAEKANNPHHYARIMEMAVKCNWEGFVVVQPDAFYADRAFNFHGKPERPKWCCKLKAHREADFVIWWNPDNGWGKWGTGKNRGLLGAAAAYLVNDDGEYEYVADVGNGFKDSDLKELSDPLLYPMVWEVRFDFWTPDGSLQFPRFVRVRHDKNPEDCTIEQRPEGV